MTRWLILRTSGGRTLPLARSLTSAGFEAWTPQRIIRRVTNQGRRSERKNDVPVPIMPTVVFAQADRLAELHWLSRTEFKPHPSFSLFRMGERTPEICDREVAGLREEEERLASLHRQMLEAETREAAEEIRIAAMREEADRRRARQQLDRKRMAEVRAAARLLPIGSGVTIVDDPAFVGIVGTVEGHSGTNSYVRIGLSTWTIEAWRLLPHGIGAGCA